MDGFRVSVSSQGFGGHPVLGREGGDFLPQVLASLFGSGVKFRLRRSLRVSCRRLVGVRAEVGLAVFLDLDDQLCDFVTVSLGLVDLSADEEKDVWPDE